MNAILDQLARSGLLVDDDMVAAIFAGNVPPLEELVMALVIGAMDCEAVVKGDPKSTWNERRIARACLTIAFLAAIACTKEQETVR
jgi:hypothetical protein